MKSLFSSLKRDSRMKQGPSGTVEMLLLIVVLCCTSAMNAQDLSGYEIMERALSGSAWDDMQAQLSLILENSRGDIRERTIAFYSRENAAEESRMLMRFKAPADVEGTGFLMIEHQDGEDERYLYLPALRRVKRVASSGSGGNFMSSDFTYYDIGSPELEDWRYTVLKDTTLDSEACYTLKCLPKTDQIRQDTGYSKILRWITKRGFNTIRSEYYDESGQKKKILTIPEFTELQGVDFASKLIMKDIQINHISIMQFNNIKLDTDIPEDFFSQRYLQRGQ